METLTTEFRQNFLFCQPLFHVHPLSHALPLTYYGWRPACLRGGKLCFAILRQAKSFAHRGPSNHVHNELSNLHDRPRALNTERRMERNDRRTK